MKTSILITGGTGFVGGRIARHLSACGYSVLISSRKELGQEMIKEHGAIGSFIHDALLDMDKFPGGIGTVIHMAALNEWDCLKYPSEAIRVNIDETRIILENAIAKGVRRFIYFSTAHIYGELKGTITEQTLPIPSHPYAITHHAAEDFVIAAAMKKRIDGLVIRLSNSFGAPIVPTVNRWTLLANDLARQAVEHKSLKLLSNGCQYRDFVCLTDVEHIIEQLIEKTPGMLKHNLYNLGAGVSMKVIDLARTIVSRYALLFGKNISLLLPEGSVTVEEPTLDFSVERLKSEGFGLANDFHAELDSLLLFCKQHFVPID